jgi:hypothetical protein
VEVVEMLSVINARTEEMQQTLDALRRRVETGTAAKTCLTTREFAAEVGRAEFTIRSACNHGRLRAEKTDNGREWRIPATELARYRRQGLLPLGEVKRTPRGY